MRRRRAIFLDRDGVINASPAQKGYITRWEEFRFLPGVLTALKSLKETGRKAIVVSNQAGVGRGIYPASQLKEITHRMLRSIRAAGGQVDAVYYCTHTPEAGCRCRKPRAGMLRKAARRFSISLEQSFVIGDNVTDIQMGKSARCRTVLVLTGVTGRNHLRRVTVKPDRVARNLREAVRWILRQP